MFSDGELDEGVVCRDFRLSTQHGAIAGKTQEKDVKYYNFKAEKEYEKFRVVQDKLFESDFDKFLKQIEKKKK